MPRTGAPSILFSLQAKTGNGAQTLTCNVDAEAPRLGMDGVPVSFSGSSQDKAVQSYKGWTGRGEFRLNAGLTDS